MRKSNKCEGLYSMNKHTYLCGAKDSKQISCKHFIQSTKKDVDVVECKYKSIVKKSGIVKCRCIDAHEELEAAYS